jgi:hypothetical protein
MEKFLLSNYHLLDDKIVDISQKERLIDFIVGSMVEGECGILAPCVICNFRGDAQPSPKTEHYPQNILLEVLAEFKTASHT